MPIPEFLSTRKGRSLPLGRGHSTLLWLTFSCMLFAVTFLGSPLADPQSRAQLPQPLIEGPRPNITQAPLASGQSSVNTITNSIQVTGPYATSVLAPDAAG